MRNRKKCRLTLIPLIITIVLLVLTGGCVGEEVNENKPDQELEYTNGDIPRLVKNITTVVKRQAKTVDWSHATNESPHSKLWGICD